MLRLSLSPFLLVSFVICRSVLVAVVCNTPSPSPLVPSLSTVAILSITNPPISSSPFRTSSNPEGPLRITTTTTTTTTTETAGTVALKYP
ncbi:uncharacterized protein UBRO_20992 [Ustilago bromivora]|uniref:Secreted protein n=1 Tax=Ustilago bromivora TaxID=307758 RepID=A0A1K0H9N6_9BASI|nr:uncharacterized protein UBRO_20992 [Ustilago bromivora]